MRKLRTAIVIADSRNQFRSGQLAGWFDNSALAVSPRGFDSVQPGAFCRQLTNEEPHAPHLSRLSVMSADPAAHCLGDMPTGIIPSNSRLRQNARKMGVGAPEFLRFASLRECDLSRV